MSSSRINDRKAPGGLRDSRPEAGNPFADIFPRFVATAVCIGKAGPPAYPEERAHMRGLAPQRAGEFAAGRFCAHRVLAALGIKAGPLLTGDNGVPAWPEGIVGSISHTTGCTVAVACHSNDASGIGVDVESGDAVTMDMVRVLCTEAERAWVCSTPGRGAALLFSAKESLFKGYFPLTGFFLEFGDVEVTLDPAERRFSARLVNDNAPSLFGGRQFHGRYRIDEHFVFTGILLMERSA